MRTSAIAKGEKIRYCNLTMLCFSLRRRAVALFLLFFLSLSFPEDTSADPWHGLLAGRSLSISPQTERLLFENNTKDRFLFSEILEDKTAYPYTATTISFTQSPFSYFAFTYDGEKASYSTRGEKLRHTECKGNLCLLLTDRNLLGVSNYEASFIKSSIFHEETFRFKLGLDVGFILTERAVYMFNGFLSQWSRLGLESERILAMGQHKELGLVLTSKRIFFHHYPRDLVWEWSHPERRFNSYEIKDQDIICYANDRVIQFHLPTQEIREILLDR